MAPLWNPFILQICKFNTGTEKKRRNKKKDKDKEDIVVKDRLNFRNLCRISEMSPCFLRRIIREEYKEEVVVKIVVSERSCHLRPLTNPMPYFSEISEMSLRKWFPAISLYGMQAWAVGYEGWWNNIAYPLREIRYKTRKE